MTTTLENLPLSVGLSVAKLRSVISSLTENVETLQARQLENDEKFKEYKKEIELIRAKELNSGTLTPLDFNTSKVDTSALSLENARLQKDLEEAVHIIDSKTQAIESLNKKVLLVESDLAQKDKELSQKNSQLKNVDMMISVFQKNMVSVRSQFSEVQERFHKEQVSADKLKRTHENIMQSQKLYQEEINKLTLDNKMKQMKIKTQDEKIADVYSKLREQTTLLEETKLKLQSEVELRTVAEGIAEEVRKEKEFFCESLKASERLLTDTTQLLRQREEAYNEVFNEKIALEKQIDELKSALDAKINPVECTEHKDAIHRLEEQVQQLSGLNKELADKVKTYQSRELVLKEEVVLQDKKIDKANEELQLVSKSLQSYKDLSAMQEKKIETLQSEIESHKALIVRLEEELLKADKKTARQSSMSVVSNSPPKPVVPPTQNGSPLAAGGRKFFTPPLPRPTTSSPVQAAIRPALVYADEDEFDDMEDAHHVPVQSAVEDVVVRQSDVERVPDEEELQEDLFVLDFDMPNRNQGRAVPEQMDIDTANDDEEYDFEAFQRASSMYPSTSGKNSVRGPNHLSSAANKRKNNLDDFIQVTPRGRPVQSKAPQAQHGTATAQHTNSTSTASTMRAPIGPSFSTYKYKQTAKKSSSNTNTGATDALGCCSDQHKHGPTIQCTSCRKKFHHSCLRQNDNRTMIKEPFTCSSCANKRKPRAKK